MNRSRSLLCGILAMTFTAGSVVADDSEAGAPDYQKTPYTLSAADLLANVALSGPNYRINDVVVNDGLVNIYELETDYGPLRVETTNLLRTRLTELDALYRMDELKGTSIYGDAVKKSGKSPIEGAKALATSPIDTTKNVVSGVGRWFADVGRAATSSDPHQEGVMKTALGQAAAQRKFAVEFGVDPYTSYEPLAKELNSLAWTATSGGLTVKVAFAAIPGPAGMAVKATSTAGSVKNLIRDKSPAQLHKIMTEKLVAIGVSKDLIKELFDNDHYSPQEKLYLTLYIEEMNEVTDRALLLAAAGKVDDESIAVYTRIRAGMLAEQARQHGGGRIMLAGGVPFLVAGDGKAIGVFPLDTVLWTSMVSTREQAISRSLANFPNVTEKHFLMSGTMHPTAREAFEAHGWTVEDGLGGG